MPMAGHVEHETILFALALAQGVLFAEHVMFAALNNHIMCSREKVHQPLHFFLVVSCGEFGGDVSDSLSQSLDGKSHDGSTNSLN